MKILILALLYLCIILANFLVLSKNVKFMPKTDNSWSDDSKSIQLSLEAVTSSLNLFTNFIKEESDSSSSSDSKSDSESNSNSLSDEDDADDSSDIEEWDSCPKSMFLNNGKCHLCSQCGQDLYVRSACTINRNTICDWCLNPSPIKNLNFRLKCLNVINFQNEFNNLLKQRFAILKNEIYQVEPVNDYLTESLVSVSVSKPLNYNFTEFNKNMTIFMRISTFIKNYKNNVIIDLCLYFVAFILLFIVFHLIHKNKRQYYKTVTINPPVFDEINKKNIIRAADEIRDKIGKNGYKRLEEFV